MTKAPLHIIFPVGLFCTLICLPVQALEWEYIIDDGDEGYLEYDPHGSWSSWSYPGAYNGDWRYLSGLYDVAGGPVPRMGAASWSVQVPVAGLYEISAHFFNTENRTTDADYYIEDADGERYHVVLNQFALPTGWHLLGEYELSEGQLSSVVLDGTDDNMSDEADAIRWKLIKETKPAAALIAPLGLLLND